MSWYRQQQNQATTLQIVQCIRLWFMPGVAEVSLELVPQTGEVRFGLDIKRTEEVNQVSDFLKSCSVFEAFYQTRYHGLTCVLICILSNTCRASYASTRSQRVHQQNVQGLEGFMRKHMQAGASL